MKPIKFSCFVFLLSLVLCAACSNDDVPVLHHPAEPEVLCYVYGEINGEPFSVEQREPDQTFEVTYTRYSPDDIADSHCLICLPLGDELDGKTRPMLSVPLAPVQRGFYQILSENDPFLGIGAYVEVDVHQQGMTRAVVYESGDKYTVRLCITELGFYYGIYPWMKGYLEGVLYDVHHPDRLLELKSVLFKVGPTYMMTDWELEQFARF